MSTNFTDMLSSFQLLYTTLLETACPLHTWPLSSRTIFDSPHPNFTELVLFASAVCSRFEPLDDEWSGIVECLETSASKVGEVGNAVEFSNYLGCQLRWKGHELRFVLLSSETIVLVLGCLSLCFSRLSRLVWHVARLCEIYLLYHFVRADEEG